MNIEEQVGSPEAATYLSDAGVKRGKKVPIHLNIDTGMGRSGFFSTEVETLKRICSLPGIKVVGIMTHFATADGENLDFTTEQIADFYKLREALNDCLPNDVLTHTHNSAATVRLTPKCNSLVRIGAACYGVRTSQDFTNPPELKPVMSVKTKVAQVRKVPAGKNYWLWQFVYYETG